MALHPAPFRSSSESRTTQRISFYKHLDGQTSTRCSRRGTGCLLNSASTINSLPYWRSRLSRHHLRSLWASTSRCAPAHATLDRRPSHCCACHFDGHHLPDDRSNPDLKLTCFLLLSANYSTYLFRQRLCSRLTALWRYINFVLLILLLLLHQWSQLMICVMCTPLHVQTAKSGVRCN